MHAEATVCHDLNMPGPTREITGASIVALGRFNPAIFQPMWFASQELISNTEAENVNLKIVAPNISSFSTDLLDIQVTNEVLTCATAVAAAPMLADLVIGALRALPFTPVYRLGINREAHYRVADEPTWHRFGHTLVPPSPWEDTLKGPGLRTLVEQGERPDEYKGWIQVKVEPSVRVHPGIFFAINDHYELAEADSLVGSEKASAVIEEKFNESLERSDAMIKSILGLIE